MDGKGRATDNIWNDLEIHQVQLHLLKPWQYRDRSAGRSAEYINYYNTKMRHTTKQSPYKRYKESITQKQHKTGLLTIKY